MLALELKIGDDENSNSLSNINYPMILYKGKAATASSSKINSTRKSSKASTSKSSSKSSSLNKRSFIKTKFVKMSFVKMRDYIKKHYNNKEFIWEPIEVVNKCINTQNPTSTNNITFNPTQKFIADYFTPASPYKGILLWHSVGTGKTCTGIATATTSFEREGYSILWVTRTTLKSDVWKNIFDQICHTIILDEVRKGLIVPDNTGERKRLLSKSWLEPMSYKQFSNLLAGKNMIYDILLERNGARDILNKTLIIIDEAHKLYGGDLKASERPDVTIMENLIKNSYIVSGADSCKLLIMTATPFTNSPLELFSLTNLFMTHESEKITTDKDEIKQQYMTTNNILSETGLKNIANKLSGYISYLNREKDPTQFAQPIMINVPVLMSHVENEDMRDAVYLHNNINSVEKDIEELIITLRTEIREAKSDLKSKKQKLKDKQTLTTAAAQTIELELDAILKKIKIMEDKIDNHKKNKRETKEKMKEFKEKVNTIKNSLLQEYILYSKCMNFNYKNNRTQKKYKLLK